MNKTPTLQLLILLYLVPQLCFAGSSYSNNLGGAPPPSSTSSELFVAKNKQGFNTKLLNVKSKVAFILEESSTKGNSNARAATSLPMILTGSEMNAISSPRSSWLTLLNNSSPITMDIGIADNLNAQTWTLPTGLLDLFQLYRNEDFIPIAEVPEDLRFPEANKVVKTEYEDGGGNIIDVYDHYVIDNDAIDYIGISYYYYLEENADTFDPEDYKFSDVPLQLGDGYTYNESATDVADRNLKYFEVDKSVDAFGTLNTPYGAFDCLRISFSTTTYTRPDVSSAYVAGAFFTSVGFITEQGHYFTGTTSGTSGSVTIDDIQFQVVAPTGILQDQSEVQINNDGDGVLISNTGVYIDVLTKTADENAILDIESDNKGIMIPRLTAANRPATPNTGLLIYQVDNTPGFYYYDGTSWTRIDNTTPSSGARIAAPTQASPQPLGVYRKGFGKLVNGSAFISLKSGVSPEELLIQLQAEGECNGLYISEKTAEGFKVKELKNGKSNTKFSWTLNQ
jgi:hypothetical protein